MYALHAVWEIAESDFQQITDLLVGVAFGIGNKAFKQRTTLNQAARTLSAFLVLCPIDEVVVIVCLLFFLPRQAFKLCVKLVTLSVSFFKLCFGLG